MSRLRDESLGRPLMISSEIEASKPKAGRPRRSGPHISVCRGFVKDRD